jgi:hypothetical protein
VVAFLRRTKEHGRPWAEARASLRAPGTDKAVYQKPTAIAKRCDNIAGNALREEARQLLAVIPGASRAKGNA